MTPQLNPPAREVRWGGGGQDQIFTFTYLLSKLMDKCMPKLVSSIFQTSD